MLASEGVEIACCFSVSVCALLLVELVMTVCRARQLGICKSLFYFLFSCFYHMIILSIVGRSLLICSDLTDFSKTFMFSVDIY